MVHVYTFLSSICALSYPASLYMEPLQEFYEAIALVSLFSLFCNYMRPTLGTQLHCIDDVGRNAQTQGSGALIANAQLKKKYGVV
jgi:hypothetical protein